MCEDQEWSGDDIVALPIDGVLDLHTFHPKEVKMLVPDYIDACLEKGITEIRIIHGKGTGTLRRIVHAILEKHPSVKGFALAGHGGGGWGATRVDLSTEGDDHGLK
jgi:dsDNA-specific endonuclease/ATPase MutS2